MFSGIVEEIGYIKSCEPTGLTIQATRVLEGSTVKESIAVDGTCLTITERGTDWFHVEAMPETLHCTRLGQLQPDSPVNLERSLPAQGRIGGHMVQGHVEAAVPVLSVQQNGIALTVEVSLPQHLRPYVITKGYIALNGASLTVIERSSDSFSVGLIPYTREHTNLGLVEPDMLLNLETDVLGRYIVQFMQNADHNYYAAGKS